jgi:hypothetical protein
MRTMRVILASGIAVAAGLFTVDASAQISSVGALTKQVTTANGATQSQVNTAVAVQTMCNYLKTPVGGGYKLPSATSAGPPLTTAPGDLFLRCNELVQTASGLQG